MNTAWWPRGLKVVSGALALLVLLLSGWSVALTAQQKAALAAAYDTPLNQVSERALALPSAAATRLFVVQELKATPQIRARIALIAPMMWRNFNPESGVSVAKMLAEPLKLDAARRPVAPAKVNDVAALAKALVRGPKVTWGKTCRPEVVFLMHSNVVCGQLPEGVDPEEAYKELLSNYTREEAVYIRYDYGSYTLMVDLKDRGLLADINFLGETGEVMVTFEKAAP